MFDAASGFLYALLYSGSTNYTGFLLTYDRWYASIYTVIIVFIYYIRFCTHITFPGSRGKGDLLLTAGVCAYNDLRFMRFWFLGGQLYHSVGFANYRFGLTGKEVCWDFSPLNILHCLQGYDPHAYLKFLCFFCIGILMFFRFVFRAPKLLPRLFARLFCFSAGYIAVVELYNLLFTAAGAVFLDISNWFLYLTGAWSAIAILTLLLVASKKFRPAPLPSTPSL